MTILHFGRKLKLPSTRAIKRELLVMMLRDEALATPTGKTFSAENSPVFEKLKRLVGWG